MSFKDFWTNENNPILEQSEYMYGTRHLLILLCVTILAVMLSIIFSSKSKKSQQILLYVLAGILLFFEISIRIVNLIVISEYSFKNIATIILPREICSIMVWVFIITIFTKKQVLYNFSVIGGLLATVIFLLYPAVGLNRTYMSFACIYSVVSHMIAFIYGVLMLSFGLVRFEFNKIWHIYLCFVIMFLWGVLLDFVIFPGENYMYLINDPLQLNVKVPYQIIYGIALVIYVAIYYIVSYLKLKIIKNKR